MPVTDDSKEVVRVPCIYYPIWFQEGQGQVKALLDSNSKINAMSPAYVEKLGLKARKTNIGVQKIDGSAFKTFEIVIADFQEADKVGRPRFFQKTFLMADTKFEVILEMPFLKISNADMAFGEKTHTWKSYTINKALLTIEQVQLVNPKEFVIAVLDEDSETFIIHVVIQEREKMAINPGKKA